MCRLRTRVALVSIAVGPVACSGGSGRDLVPYYDPQELFNASLPAANDITVTPPQPPASDVPGLLTGVIAAPPQPSPSPQAGGFGGGLNLGQTAATHQTTYEAFVVTSDTFGDLNAMTLYFLTGDPIVDVQHEEAVRIAGSSGRLIVADVTQGGQVTSSVAAAVSLGTGGDGYLVAAIFPSGGWDAERADFLRVFASFRAGVPPGFDVPRDQRERLIASRPFGPWGNGSPADSGSASPSSNLGGPATTATRAGPGRQQTPTSFVSVLLLSLDSVTSSFASASAVTVPPTR